MSKINFDQKKFKKWRERKEFIINDLRIIDEKVLQRAIHEFEHIVPDDEQVVEWLEEAAKDLLSSAKDIRKLYQDLDKI